jgi:hypothetical protein
MAMALKSVFAGLGLLITAGAAHAQTPDPARSQQRAAVQAELAGFTSERLTRFGSDESFRRYLGTVLAAQRLRWAHNAAAPKARFAASAAFGGAQTGAVQSDAVDPICPDSDPECGAVLQQQSITVTGSRVSAPSNPSITNNQMRNVEEGDIVKQIGNFLLVLQDGRVFVVDIRAGRGANSRRLALSDRMNVYRDPTEDMWYDEMLVFGDRVLITGYSYNHDATELSVLRLDPSGRLSRQGVFHLSSNDYYSSSNYATRLIGDKLVIYTPFSVADMAQASFRWPVVRRWMPDEGRIAAQKRGRSLFNGSEVYRPARFDDDPTVHTVSVCPLADVGEDRDLQCRTTAFAGPDRAQWYVTETDAYLWTTASDHYSYDSRACDAPLSFERDYRPALLYRVPVNGRSPQIVATRGLPPDQFSLHSTGGRFLALLQNRPPYCRDEPAAEASLSFLDIPLSSFSDTVRDAPRDRYTALPGIGTHHVANRFTDRYLIYGSLGRSRRGLSEDGTPPAYLVPVTAPKAARRLDIRHSVIRAEQAGEDFVLTGYRNKEGLVVTLIDLDRRPGIASSVELPERFESDGRSHAFNSRIEADGSGVMGLPTISGENRSSRSAWRSSASDLSYLAVDRHGQLRSVGELEQRFRYRNEDDDDDGIRGYSCEVSCIDWYGNSRPIFTDGRIFALAGTQLIEGRIVGGEIAEVQRINIARPPGNVTARAK